MSGSTLSFVSWASNLTQCSNPTFNKVIDRLWSNPNMQKDVLAVLSGITKLIKSRNGTQSTAEYYAALLSLMNTRSTTKTAEAYLLRLAISKAVPIALLRKTHAESTKTLTNVLSAALLESELDTTLCKLLLLSLGRILAVQSNESWSTESVRHTYRHFLKFVDHPHPAIRKACHSSVTEILASSLSTNNSFHPVCHQTVNHLCLILKQNQEHLSTLINPTDADCNQLLHALHLLKCTLTLVPEKDVKIGCECTLELTNFPNPVVVKSAYECLQSIFVGRVKQTSVSIDLAGKLLSALLTCGPQDSTGIDLSSQQRDSELVTSWLRCLADGAAHMVALTLDTELNVSSNVVLNVATEHLDHLIKIILNIVVNSPFQALRSSSKDILGALFANSLKTLLQNNDISVRRPRLLLDICLDLQNALSLSRREIWPHILYLTAQLFQIWPSSITDYANCPPDQRLLPLEVIAILEHVGHLRDAFVDGSTAFELGTVDSVDEATCLIDEMDLLVYTALETWGIEVILKKALPLHPLLDELESGCVELRRSWILPLIIRIHPSWPCSLLYFHTHILPLADRAITVAKSAASRSITQKADHKKFGSKFVPLSAILNAGVGLARQLWAILTPFTRKPPFRWEDLIDSGLGGRLVHGLLTANTLRPTILSSLRRLIAFAETEESINVMRAGAKQIVPRILSLFEEQSVAKDQKLKQQLRATLSVFFPLLTPKMLTVPCEMAINKLKSTKSPIYMEILQLIAPNISSDDIKSLLHQLANYFSVNNVDNPNLRKPAYLLLESVLSSSSESAQNFVKQNINYLIEFVQKISSSQPASTDGNSSDLCAYMNHLSVSHTKKHVIPWKSRLRILRHLLKVLVLQDIDSQTESSDWKTNISIKEFVNHFLPEVLPCFNNLNSLVRIFASRLVVDMVKASSGLTTTQTLLGRKNSHKLSYAPSFSNYTSASDLNSVMSDIDDENASHASDAQSRAASVCTAISTTPINSDVAIRICISLNNILLPLWPILLNKSIVGTNSSDNELRNTVMVAKCVKNVLSDSSLRRALLTCLVGDSEIMEAVDIITRANSATQSLTSSPNRQLARLGLDLTRLLVAFVGKSFFVSDIVCAIQGIHPSQKKPLRFAVKAIIEKLLKRISVQALQSLMDINYHKMIRNSSKLLTRRERKRSLDRGDNLPADRDDDSNNKMSKSVHKSTSSLSGIFSRSAVSEASTLQARHAHVESFDEVLAESCAVDEKMEDTKLPIISHPDGNSSPPRRQGLAEELESAASVAGLSRRSRKLPKRSESDSSEEEAYSRLDRTHVRFADEVAKFNSCRKRRGSNNLDTDNGISTWLVEDADEEVLDLADPQALSRHITMATSADFAKSAHLAHHNSLASSHKRARLTSLSSIFPVRDGRLVIDETSSDLAEKIDDWSLAADDSELPIAPSKFSRWSSVGMSKNLKPARLPGASYKSSRAHGDMKKPGLPDPFAYIPLGAGLSSEGRSSGARRVFSKGKVASDSERRQLLRSIGVGKQKKNKLRNKSKEHTYALKKGTKARTSRHPSKGSKKR